MQAIDATLQRAVLDIVSDKLNGYHTLPSHEAPDTLDKARAYFIKHGAVGVDTANSEETIWAHPAVNYAFRAWHDWRHITENAEFNDAGEWLVHLAMLRDLDEWARRQGASVTPHDLKRARATLGAENVGQLDYWRASGSPPTNQRAFAEFYLDARGLL
jgi:hypothetical protein